MSITPTAAPAPPVPDAVILPTGCNIGDNSLERSLHVCDLAESILGVDRSIGERGHCFFGRNGEFFCTKDLTDTIAFPKGHRYEGHPRYNWVNGEDGSRYGYLVPQARKPKPSTPPPVAEVTNAG